MSWMVNSTSNILFISRVIEIAKKSIQTGKHINN